MSNSIEFFCYENDEPIEVQLEPEAIIFVASPGNSLRFVAVKYEDDFKWAIRIDHSNKGIQLFPDTLKLYDIEIYKNNELLSDW